MEYYSSFLKLSLPILIASYSLFVPTVSKPSINPVSSHSQQDSVSGATLDSTNSKYITYNSSDQPSSLQLQRYRSSSHHQGGPVFRVNDNTPPLLLLQKKERNDEISESLKKLDSPMLSELEGDNSRSKMKVIRSRRIRGNNNNITAYSTNHDGMSVLGDIITKRVRAVAANRNRSGNKSYSEHFRASPLLNVVRVGNMNGDGRPELMSESTWVASSTGFHHTGQIQYNAAEASLPLSPEPSPNFGNEEMKFDISNGTLPPSSIVFIKQNNDNGNLLATSREHFPRARDRELSSQGQINRSFHPEPEHHQLDNSALSVSSDLSTYSTHHHHHQKDLLDKEFSPTGTNNKKQYAEVPVPTSPALSSSVVSLKGLQDMVRSGGQRRLPKKNGDNDDENEKKVLVKVLHKRMKQNKAGTSQNSSLSLGTNKKNSLKRSNGDLSYNNHDSYYNNYYYKKNSRGESINQYYDDDDHDEHDNHNNRQSHVKENSRSGGSSFVSSSPPEKAGESLTSRYGLKSELSPPHETKQFHHGFYGLYHPEHSQSFNTGFGYDVTSLLKTPRHHQQHHFEEDQAYGNHNNRDGHDDSETSNDHHHYQYHQGGVHNEDSLKEDMNEHSSHGHQSHHDDHDHHHQHHESDKLLLAKTLIGTKTLKVGTSFLIGILVIGLLGMAFLAKTGVFLTPLVLPLAFLPVGVIALALFVPLVCLFVPIIAVGLAGSGRRKKRSVGGYPKKMKNLMRWQQNFYRDVNDYYFHYSRDILQPKESEMIYFYPPVVKEAPTTTTNTTYWDDHIGISLMSSFLRKLLNVSSD